MFNFFCRLCVTSVILIASLAASFNLHAAGKNKETAIFATGCFWCTEKDFEGVKGVISAESGYIRGHVEKPNYKQVSAGTTGHTEAVRVIYDRNEVSYEDLLSVFWYSSDPFVKDQQFCDHGSQYRSGIYYLGEAQKQAALDSKEQLVKRHNITDTIYTEILPATKFWPAEEFHQDYYKKNSFRYHFYRLGCGREDRLETIWESRAGWKPKT